MVNPDHITPYPEIPENERELADDLVFNGREDALGPFIGDFDRRARRTKRAVPIRRPTWSRGGAPLADPPAQEGRRRGLDRPLGREDRRGPDSQRGPAPRDEGGGRQVRRRRADPAVRAPVGRGDEARGRPARELPRADRGPHEGQGRDRDRLRGCARHWQVARQYHPHEQRGHCRDLGKQVPVDTIISAAQEHDATAIGLSALLVSTSKQMPLCIQELHQRGLEDPVLIGGAAINATSGAGSSIRRARSRTTSTSRRLYCKDAFQGLDTWTSWSSPRRARRSSPRCRPGEHSAREARGQGRRIAGDGRLGALDGADGDPDPRAAVWGSASRGGPRQRVPYLDRDVLFQLHWGGRGKRRGVEAAVAGDGEDEGSAKLERMWREQDYIEPRRRSATSRAMRTAMSW